MSTAPTGESTRDDDGGDGPALEMRELPATARGVRTRLALVEAARRVFERDGYLDSRLVDIAAEAGCSTGTFYTYFDNKEQAFAAVLEEAREEMLHPGIDKVGLEADPVVVVEASTRAYLEAYRRNAQLMGLFEQVANIDPRFRELRRRRARAFAERNARAIADLQERGLADATLDPLMASRALSGMVSRLAYQCYVLGDEMAFDDLVRTSVKLWANALRLPGSSP